MLTVAEAARRTGKHPGTIRRWIREGKLHARKIGTQLVIDEADLLGVLSPPVGSTLPLAWRTTFWGGPMPDVVAVVRRSRHDH